MQRDKGPIYTQTRGERLIYRDNPGTYIHTEVTRDRGGGDINQLHYNVYTFIINFSIAVCIHFLHHICHLVFCHLVAWNKNISEKNTEKLQKLLHLKELRVKSYTG